MKRMREREPKGWGNQQQQQVESSQMTLSDIQRLQEEKDREERTRIQLQQQQVQAMYEAQMKMQQKSGQLGTWSSSALNQSPSSHVKTLAEIQKEEADRLSKLKREQELRDRENASALSNAGIWGNASSQLSWKSKQSTAGKQSTSSGVRQLKNSINLTPLRLKNQPQPDSGPVMMILPSLPTLLYRLNVTNQQRHKVPLIIHRVGHMLIISNLKPPKVVVIILPTRVGRTR